MESKRKLCKGIGRAKDFEGCPKMVSKRTYGLCDTCYYKWLYSTEEGAKKVEKLSIKAKKDVEKNEKIETKRLKKEIKTSAELKKYLQTKVNEIVRLIDSEQPCISCNHGHFSWTRRKQAGHFYSVGSSSTIRFHLDNIHTQCSICNEHLSGNERKYAKGLIERYGQEYLNSVIQLKQIQPIKLEKYQIEEIIKIANKILRNIKKGSDYTRDEVNELLGIYNAKT